MITNDIDLEEIGRSFMDRYDRPTPLFTGGTHAVYWLGTPEDTAFRCNTYLIVDNQEAVVVDPGGLTSHPFILDRIRQIVPAESVKALILCHQDPDVAASVVPWLDLNPEICIVTSYRTNILLPHYGRLDYSWLNINEKGEYLFQSGNGLRFVESPFLHFPGAFTTIDETTGFLFSGDIWGAIDMDWRLVVTDIQKHELKMSLYHVDYMAGNLACRGFLKNLAPFVPSAILPQHGSVIPGRYVPRALEYLKNLKCGMDLVFAGL